MALPTPAAGRNGLLSFRLFGFPVTIHASFLLIVLVLGYSARTGVSGALLWLVVVTVSVIAHELGHAFVAKPAGGDPRIDLYMLAGLTTWHPGRASRLRRVAVSVAGPAAGVVFGLLVLLAYGVVDPEQGTLLHDAFLSAVFVNLGWGLLNLLPMLPLDGGQVVLALMPGDDDLVRIRRASYVSLAVAALVVVGALAMGDPIAAVLVLFFGAGNLQRVVALRQGARGGDAGERLFAEADEALQRNDPETVLRMFSGELPEAFALHAAVFRAIALLRLGRAREAQQQLVDLPPGFLDPVFEATVLLANGQDRLARERLAPALAANPAGWAVRELVLVLRAQNADVVGVIGGLTGHAATGVLDALYLTGDYDAAAAWGERALATGATGPVVAYNTACAYARAGDAERALRSLGYAAELGWSDVRTAEEDPDLAAVRAAAGWPAVRERMVANAGLGTPSSAR